MGGCFQKDQNITFNSQTFSVTLIKRQQISHDSYIFTFSLPNQEEQIMSSLTEHLIIFGKTQSGWPVTRKYTVTSPYEQKGTFEIPIKIYRPNVNPQFPQGGKLTPWLEQIDV